MQETEIGPFGLPGQLAQEIINEGERYLPIVADYNAAMHLGHMSAYREALKYAYGRSVLEIGCGVGYGSFFLASYGAKHVTALDLGFTALRYARDIYRHPNLDLLQANGQELPFANQSFDFVFSTQVIEHVPSVEKFLGEVRRVLKPTGTCLIVTPNQMLFSPDHQNTNPHHISEMDVETFRCQMQKVFPHVTMLGTPQNSLKWDAATGQMGVRSNSEVSIYDFANQKDNLETCENLLGFGRFSAGDEVNDNFPARLNPVVEELAPFFWDAGVQSWTVMGIYPVENPRFSIVFGWLPKRLQQSFISPRNGLYRIQVGTYAVLPGPMSVKLIAQGNPDQCLAQAAIQPGKRFFDFVFPPQADSRNKEYCLILEAGMNLPGYLRLRPSIRFAALSPNENVKSCTINGVEQNVRLALRTFHIDLPPVNAGKLQNVPANTGNQRF